MSRGTAKSPISVTACRTPIASRSLAQNTASGRSSARRARNCSPTERPASTLSECFVGPAQPVLHLTKGKRAANKRHPAPTSCAKMFCRKPTARDVVHSDRRERGASGVTVDEHNRCAVGLQGEHTAHVIADRGHQ